jgi:hypothetical protein
MKCFLRLVEQKSRILGVAFVRLHDRQKHKSKTKACLLCNLLCDEFCLSKRLFKKYFAVILGTY